MLKKESKIKYLFLSELTEDLFSVSYNDSNDFILQDFLSRKIKLP